MCLLHVLEGKDVMLVVVCAWYKQFEAFCDQFCAMLGGRLKEVGGGITWLSAYICNNIADDFNIGRE